MDEIIQFISKAERERMRLVREAHAVYESIFPSTGPAKQPLRTSIGSAVGAPISAAAKSPDQVRIAIRAL